MDWIIILKDLGGLALPLIGIIGGVFVYLRHNRKLKSQEKRLNDMQIRQMEKAEEKECQAEIKCYVIKGNKVNRTIRFVNAGQSDAKNVRINILTPKEELSSVYFHGELGPYDMIDPQSSREEHISLCINHPDIISLKVMWDDSYQKDRTVMLSVQL